MNLLRALALAAALGSAALYVPAQERGAVAQARAVLEQQLRAGYPLQTLRLEAVPEGLAPDIAVDTCRVRGVDTALRRRMFATLECGARTLRLGFEVEATVLAWQVSSDIPAGTPLTAADASAVTQDALAFPDALVAGSVEGLRARRSLASGHVLRRADVVPAASVLRGDAVEVVYQAGALAVSARGQALNDAMQGQPVRVVVATQREPVVGRLVAPTLVQVQP